MYAVLVHIVLVVAVSASVLFNKPLLNNEIVQSEKPIIQAGLVDYQSIEAAVKRQEQQEAKRKHEVLEQKKQAEKFKKMAKKAQQEAKRAKQETKKVHHAKQLAAKEKAQLESEKAKLLAAKKKAQEEKKQLEAQAQKASEENRRLEAKKEKVQTAIAIAQAKMKIQQELEEKAKAQLKKVQRTRWLDSTQERYKEEIKLAVLEHRIISTAFTEDLKCILNIKLFPDGSLKAVSIAKSSGNLAYDSMNERAVRRAAPFELPEDVELRRRFENLSIEFGIDEAYYS